MVRTSSSFLAPALLFTLATGPACARPEAPRTAELALGRPAPPFQLKGVDGRVHALADFKDSKAVVVVFTCLSCPYARAYEDRVLGLARDYAERGVQVVGIVSNDPRIVPADGFESLKSRAAEMQYPFPLLVDETQEVARAYGARVTPHVFVFGPGPERALVYRGRIDDETDPPKVTRHDLRSALDAMLAGKPVPVGSTKAFGCTIKWKAERSS